MEDDGYREAKARRQQHGRERERRERKVWESRAREGEERGARDQRGKGQPVGRLSARERERERERDDAAREDPGSPGGEAADSLHGSGPSSVPSTQSTTLSHFQWRGMQ